MILGSGYLNGHKKGCLILVFSVSTHLAILRLASLLFFIAWGFLNLLSTTSYFDDGPDIAD